MTRVRVDSLFILPQAVAARLICQIIQYIKFTLDSPISLLVLLWAIYHYFIYSLVSGFWQRSRTICILFFFYIVSKYYLESDKRNNMTWNN